jgi:hypothetical protein
MQMKTTPNRQAIPLFDDRAAAAEGEARTRLRSFAEAVARRHRRSKAGVPEFATALHGYYRTLAICAETNLPPLDDELTSFAIGAYLAVRSHRHSAAA